MAKKLTSYNDPDIQLLFDIIVNKLSEKYKIQGGGSKLCLFYDKKKQSYKMFINDLKDIHRQPYIIIRKS